MIRTTESRDSRPCDTDRLIASFTMTDAKEMSALFFLRRRNLTSLSGSLRKWGATVDPSDVAEAFILRWINLVDGRATLHGLSASIDRWSMSDGVYASRRLKPHDACSTATWQASSSFRPLAVGSANRRSHAHCLVRQVSSPRIKTAVALMRLNVVQRRAVLQGREPSVAGPKYERRLQKTQGRTTPMGFVTLAVFGVTVRDPARPWFKACLTSR